MSSTQVLQSGDGVLMRNSVGDVLYFVCSAIPTSTSAPDNAPGNSVAGFAVGCMAVRSDNGSDTAMIYFNTGSTTSCTWAALRVSAGG